MAIQRTFPFMHEDWLSYVTTCDLLWPISLGKDD